MWPSSSITKPEPASPNGWPIPTESDAVEMRTTLPTILWYTSPIRLSVAAATTAVGAGGAVGSAVGTAVGSGVGTTVGTAVGSIVGMGVGSAVGTTVGSGTRGCRCSEATVVPEVCPAVLVSAALGPSRRRMMPITVSVVPTATTRNNAPIAPGTMRRLRHVRLRYRSGSYGLVPTAPLPGQPNRERIPCSLGTRDG